MSPQPEVWLRGPVEGYEPLLMPAVHALLQAREDLEHLAHPCRTSTCGNAPAARLPSVFTCATWAAPSNG